MWFPNLYLVKPVKAPLPEDVQRKENKKKGKKVTKGDIKKKRINTSEASFNRYVINRYYRAF